MIKKVLIAVSCLAIVLMSYLLYRSIQQPIEFQEAKDAREAAIIKRLIDIRTAQIEYNEQNEQYCGDWDSLITFIKTAEKKVVKKEGTLTDAMLMKGLTEKKAMELKPEEAEKYGVTDYETFKATFKRDTTTEMVLTSTFPEGFNPDELKQVPGIPNATFELEAVVNENPVTGSKIPLFEAKVPYEVYLQGLDRQEIINLIDQAKNMEKYPGLKVGDVVKANNNAGNWE